ncbi:MAG: hypothetical protein K5663_11425 [Clostridiales bacterium]|nr:hypothetical protein [Clostridiales bacterium]
MAYALYIGQSAQQLTGVRPPNEMSVTISDVDASTTGRPASGYIVRSVVRGMATAVRSVELRWQNLPLSAASVILNAFGEEFYYLRYQDPFTADWRTSRFYTSDRKCTVKRMLDGQSFIGELSFTCVER